MIEDDDVLRDWEEKEPLDGEKVGSLRKVVSPLRH